MPTVLRPWAALAGLALVLSPVPSRAAESAGQPQHSAWQPDKTWVFAVSCTVWKHDRGLNMPKKGREDGKLVAAFKARGVPPDHIVFLKDEAGTLARIKASFEDLLRKTRRDDTLVFYFQGHGSRDVDNGKATYYFVNYDATDARDDSYLYMKDVYDLIEKHFKGSRVLLTADCCCSGGLAVEARKRHTSIAYACLTSTYAHNGSTGNWTYTDSLIRGLNGNAVADLDGNGALTLRELATYTEHRMAFAEGQKAVFETFNGFDPQFELAPAARKADRQIGRLVECLWDDGKWYRGEIDDVKGGKLHVTYADGDEKWVKPADVRDAKLKELPRGTHVRARNEDADDKWQNAVVVESWYGLHLVHFDGQKSSVEDQWESADRIKPRD